MQRKKRLIFIGIIVVVAAVFLYSRSESHFPFYHYIDTNFSKNFSWERYNNVSIGMKKGEVQSLLGEPLRKFNTAGSTDPGECWDYSSDGKLSPYADFSWYWVQVCFTKDSVSSKPINEFFD